MDGIIEQLKKIGSLNTFIGLIEKAEVEDKLNEEGPFTVFAPNDEAFGELPESTVNELATNSKGLEEIINYHVVSGEFSKKDLESIPILETLQGESLLVESENGNITINDAALLKSDIEYSGGILHLIDSVLMP
ncbi:fasciclin domain-containing protein [Candidatus Microgenomates bacterium]|jgi:uncharacterized surface protein with fasciclin (FAS1) repeats|nr:MAG: fasciclin domain-containing protein [Candidatus Microgenomates bacterium]